MQALELETSAAGRFAYAAVRDARMRNIANASHYSEAQKLQAERMKLVMEFVYNYDAVYINYRKNKIAIKVDNARVKDSILLKEFEADWEAKGITKTLSAQGVIYSFK